MGRQPSSWAWTMLGVACTGPMEIGEKISPRVAEVSCVDRLSDGTIDSDAPKWVDTPGGLYGCAEYEAFEAAGLQWCSLHGDRDSGTGRGDAYCCICGGGCPSTGCTTVTSTSTASATATTGTTTTGTSTTVTTSTCALGCRTGHASACPGAAVAVRDTHGDPCTWYDEDDAWTMAQCGSYDDADFSANLMCCSCANSAGGEIRGQVGAAGGEQPSAAWRAAGGGRSGRGGRPAPAGGGPAVCQGLGFPHVAIDTGRA
ncbi:unnamed protein product [Prorocentrum cordatum]|uniref:Cellulase n=1 Tax=Prorocentrum cordatum TaxID=2364126 RepID=A0ABN9XPD5_9DINO|nr:unnamed protein product [Polarella glacialis]